MTSEYLPRWIRANGLDFAYLEAGEGPLVLCLHGFPDTAWSFRPLLTVLAAAGFRAVAPFMRGYAPTSIPADGDYRIETLGRDAIALIEALGAERAGIVGHDWGAITAYAAASLAPERITRMVTAAVPHLRRFVLKPSLRQLYRSRYIGFFQLPEISEHIVARRDFFYLENLIREWSPDWDFTATDIAPLKGMWSVPERLTAALSYYRALPGGLVDSSAWRTYMRPITVPTQVIYGARDGCIGPEMFTNMHHLFPAGLNLVEMKQAGHFMYISQPDIFSRHVVDFLKRNT